MPNRSRPETLPLLVLACGEYATAAYPMLLCSHLNRAQTCPTVPTTPQSAASAALLKMQRPRASSIPRNYRRIPPHERFSVADAAQLKLKLQALDDKLDPNVDVQTLQSACQPRPFHEEIYVDGSEEFFLLVKGIARADLIPNTYIEAYATLQQGRFPLNHFRVSDFTQGVDPTFSEMRRLLRPIDALCGTRLDGSLRALEDGGRCIRVAPSPPPSLANASQSRPFRFCSSPPSSRCRYTHICCLAKPTCPSCAPSAAPTTLRASV
jgi:hypothetical protein